MGRKTIAILITAAFFYICSPFILPVAMGGIFAVLFTPVVEKLGKARFFSKRLSSALLTLAVTLLLLIPISTLIFMGAKAGVQQLQILKEGPAQRTWIEGLLSIPKLDRLMDWVTTLYPVTKSELIDAAGELGREIALKLADLLGGFLRQLPGLVVWLVVIVLSMYFFLVDGHRLVHFARRNSFFSPTQTDRLLNQLSTMCRSVVYAAVISGTAQALLESTACLVVGLPNVLLIGTIVLIASFVPVVGSAPVTFGIALQTLLIDGHTGAGVFLIIAACLVAVLDNLIRPMFLKGAANLHPLVAFIAAFGGLEMLGFVGIFLGPIVAAAFLAIIRILEEKEPTLSH